MLLPVAQATVSILLAAAAVLAAGSCKKEVPYGSSLAENTPSVFTEDAFKKPKENLLFKADKAIVPIPGTNKSLPKIHIINGSGKEFDAKMWFNQTPIGDTSQKTKKIGDFSVAVDENDQPIARDVKWPVAKEGEKIDNKTIMPWQGDVIPGAKRFVAGEEIIWGRRGVGSTQLKLADPVTGNDISSQFQLEFNEELQTATIVNAPAANVAEASPVVSEPQATAPAQDAEVTLE